MSNAGVKGNLVNAGLVVLAGLRANRALLGMRWGVWDCWFYSAHTSAPQTLRPEFHIYAHFQFNVSTVPICSNPS